MIEGGLIGAFHAGRGKRDLRISGEEVARYEGKNATENRPAGKQ